MSLISQHGFILLKHYPDILMMFMLNKQVCPYGLYAEQLSGSAFTAPRHKNLRTWLYRIRPSSCSSGRYTRLTDTQSTDSDTGLFDLGFDKIVPDPNPFRWDPTVIPDHGVDFVKVSHNLHIS